MTARAVFDTSTLVSAALRKGSVPRRALERALDMFELCVSEAGLAQLESVLARERMSRFISTEARSAFLEFVRSRFVELQVSDDDLAGVVPACRDTTDNLILALAAVARAKFIVSSDNDLLVLHPLARYRHLDARAVPRPV